MLDAFGTTIYTNCAPGQGLDGVAGMQFQSRSEGLDRRLLDVVRRHLLYELPQQMLRENRPVADFPVSFGHVHDGTVWATAAGVYVGREASGSRPGNHLTNAILTENPKSYRSVRPAQLFGAQFWRTEPWPSTRSRPLERWLPGPLDATAAARFVAQQPRGDEMLAVLLTELMSVDPNRQHRIVFLAEEARPVLLWLTAATLLLPQSAALRIGFKIFTNDPARSALRIAAVNPYWSSFAGTVENDLGYMIFDLVRSLWPSAEPSAEARHWVELFQNSDPFAVSEAVELAAAAASVGPAAADLASAAVLKRMPDARHVPAIIRWLRGGGALREAYGGTLLTVLGRTTDTGVLQACEEIAEKFFPHRRDEMRLRWLRAEMDHAIRTTRPSPTAGTVGPALSPAAADEARDILIPALRIHRGATFEALMQVAARFGVQLEPSDARPAFEAFARFWIDNPGQGYDPRRWPAGVPVLEMVRTALSHRLDGGEATADGVGNAWWPSLVDPDSRNVDFDARLDRALISAAMVYAGPDVRSRLVRCHVRAGNAEIRKVTEVLWDRASITVSEAHAVISAAPHGSDLSPRLFEGLVLEAIGSDPTSLPALELCGQMSQRGLLRLNAQVESLISQHQLLLRLRNELFNRKFVYEPDTVKRLQVLTPKLVRAHVSSLVERMNECDDLTLVWQLLRILPASVVATYLTQWSDRATRTRRPNWMAITYYLIHAYYTDAEVIRAHNQMSTPCFDALLSFVQRGDPAEISEVRAHLAHLDEKWAYNWDQFLLKSKPNQRRIFGIKFGR